jgi:hypothetical protein
MPSIASETVAGELMGAGRCSRRHHCSVRRACLARGHPAAGVRVLRERKPPGCPGGIMRGYGGSR